MYVKFLSRAELEYALKTQQSIRAAAIYLNVAYNTLRRYAKMYDDPENPGQSLLDRYKNKPGKGKYKDLRPRVRFADVLKGKHPWYDKRKLKRQLIIEKILDESCNHCGFAERRVHDGEMPILLAHKDGDLTNMKLENLEFLCFNCYFLYVGVNGPGGGKRKAAANRDDSILMTLKSSSGVIPDQFFDPKINDKVAALEENQIPEPRTFKYTPAASYIMTPEEYMEIAAIASGAMK